MGSLNRMRRSACIFVLALPAAAQLELRWEHSLPAAFLQGPVHAGSALLPDGSLVVAGTGGNPAPGIVQTVVLARFGADGTTLWSRTFEPAANIDTASDLTFDPVSGDLFLIGATRASGAPDTDLRLSRFDVLGNLVWSTVHATALDDDGDVVRVDSSGIVWVAARATLLVQPHTATGSLLRFTLAGAPLAGVTLPPGNHASFGMEPHPAGGIALVQDAYVPGLGTQLTLRADSSGNVLWSRSRTSGLVTFGGRRLACAANGDVVVCGTQQSNALLVDYDASGNVRWARVYDDGTGFDQSLLGVAVDAQGAVVAVGVTTDVVNYTMETFAMRCDANGGVSWSRRSNPFGQDIDAYYDVVLDAAGGALVAGVVVEPVPSTVQHGVLVRYDRDGAVRGIFRHVASPGASSFLLACSSAGDGDFVASGVGNGLLAVRVHEQGVPFCVGDGSATSCPCGNASATYDQSGCRYNASTASRLVDQGVARISADSLVLELRGAPASGPVIFVQGDQRANGGAGVLYGDGLLCVGDNVTRLGSVNASSGVARLGASGTPHVSALGNLLAPGVRTYQAFHRSLASFCTPATMGTSNGLEVTWSP